MDTTPSALSIAPRPSPGHRRFLRLIGPAWVAAIAYVDPGNFATNIQAGAGYGYLLLWVALLACLAAMPIQYLSGKLGIVTGRDLALMCRRRFPRPVVRLLWVQAEIVAMATDVAEFTGAALALNLLFGVPMLPATLVTGVATLFLLSLRRRGRRSLQLVTPLLLAVVCAGLLYLVVRTGASGEGMLAGLRPAFADDTSVLLAIGMIGATIMPHALYLQSDLAGGRRYGDGDREPALRAARVDVALALGLAGVVNLAIIVFAARLFAGGGGQPTIEDTHGALLGVLGAGAAVTFAVALLASGLSSASVGTYVGQVVMRGFLGRTVPVWLRRAITMAPALVLPAVGVDSTSTLVISQVVLSFGIPFALVPLLVLTGSRSVMGEHVNRKATTVVCAGIAAAVIGLNTVLLHQQLLG
ncbi:Nramp family divalent metal transporter [Actinosynnema sp. CS-041913]|uniref:Nramp family divalent metal transporter n=1 Tax=Actinosynnema sp. CS-041913 TaxID=3239917 RepID=UPI003D92C060